MPLALTRLVDPTQAATAGANNTVHTVPVGRAHIVKSMIVRNTRSDGATITYSLYVVPSGQTFDQYQHRWVIDDTLAPGETKSLDFGLLVLKAGDTVVIKPSHTALRYEAHGMEQA